MINPLGLVYVFELMNEMNEIKYSVFDLDLIIILYHFHVMKEILYERNKSDLRPLNERNKKNCTLSFKRSKFFIR